MVFAVHLYESLVENLWSNAILYLKNFYLHLENFDVLFCPSSCPSDRKVCQHLADQDWMEELTICCTQEECPCPEDGPMYSRPKK